MNDQTIPTDWPALFCPRCGAAVWVWASNGRPCVCSECQFDGPWPDENGVRLVALPADDEASETVWHRLTILLELPPDVDPQDVREEVADVLMDMTNVVGFTTHVERLDV